MMKKKTAMACCFPLEIMLLCILFMLYSMFYIGCGCVAEERVALMHLRSSLPEASRSGPFALPPWGHSGDCCNWSCVSCDGKGHVSELRLPPSPYLLEQDFEDPIAVGECWNLNISVFSPLHELRLLDLSWNLICLQNLDGFQGLTKLRNLDLSYNRFIGNNIMEFLAKLPSLEVLILANTSMSGPLQNIGFQGFPKLRLLDLSNNNFTGSNGVGSLVKLPSLEVLNLDSTNISGPLQHIAFSDFKKLRELHIGSNLLNGSIPESLFDLPHLELLDLSGNLLVGNIPISSSVNLSSSLQTIKLSKNNLSGVFDFFWLRNCTMLKDIDLSGNTNLAVNVKCRGQVPQFQLRSLMLSGCNLDNRIITEANFLVTQHQLQVLDLSNNNLMGSIPNWIFINEAILNRRNCHSNLSVLNISMNQFEGKLPSNISLVFPNLESLDASHNIISGDVPPSFCDMGTIFLLDLSNNKLTGEVPTCLLTNSPILFLKLSNNNLGGPIFGGASVLSIASALHLDNNNFEGVLPSNLSASYYMQILDLSHNKLSGKLDVSFWDLPSLQVLSVADNKLTGQIYQTICNFSVLQFLDVSENNFIGDIPNCNNKLTLRFLNMSGSSLSGFSSAFFNSSYVTTLDLRYNQLTGTLDWLHCLSGIRFLLLGGNIFDGHIPQNICQLEYLNVIDLSHNRLSGSLPPCIGAIPFGTHAHDIPFSFIDVDLPADVTIDGDGPSFEWIIPPYDLQGFTFFTKGNIYTYGPNFMTLMFGIDLSGNMLSGGIPQEIGNLSHIKSLSLSHNLFTGHIPASFANMASMESLDLSHNDLSGPIPQELTQLWSLEIFSVAYNNLSGCIPTYGQFGTFSMDSYQGNSNLQNLCSNDPSHVTPALEDVEETHGDPILCVISAVSFVLAFWATVTFFFSTQIWPLSYSH